MNEFDDIRPYDDAEVPSVISRLLRDNDFLDLLLSRRLPRLSNLVPVRFLMRPILRNSLAKLAADVSTVEDFQAHMTSALRN
ncbi:MAG: hypothetical protein HOL11_03065, partial [Porticoccaceae bacterium]|nr:hypothetical protein [Porticoccaceae bacterium]